jgi:hypothetical protein
MMRWTNVAVVIFAILFLSGCCVYESVCVKNSSGNDVEFYTGHTNMRYIIEHDATKTIPHSDGLCVITSKTGEIWRYSNISLWPEDGVQVKLTHQHKYLIMREVVLNLLLEKNGTLYYLSPARDERKAFKKNQPAGFPLQPENKRKQ